MVEFIHPNLYSLSGTGKVVVWYVIQEDDTYTSYWSYEGSAALSNSGPTTAVPTNVGRSNARNGVEQASFEIEALYKDKIKVHNYHVNRADVKVSADYFEPMLAKKYDPVKPLTFPVFLQPKFNGVRCILKQEGLFTRTGNQLPNCPHIEEASAGFFAKYPDAILDGELYNHEYKNDFNTLISSIKKTTVSYATRLTSSKVVKFYLYDGWSNQRFELRWTELQNIFYENFDNDCMELSPTIRTNNRDSIKLAHEKFVKAGYEGTMVRLNAPYENKRSDNLLKYKDFKDAEFIILDIEEGKGTWAGHGKSVKLKLPPTVRSAAGKDYFNAGVKGSKAFCKKLLEEKHKHIGQLATIQYQDLTPDGVPLFPIFIAVRDYE